MCIRDRHLLSVCARQRRSGGQWCVGDAPGMPGQASLIWDYSTALVKLTLGAAAGKPARRQPLGYGVIGNTTVSGTVILGSSPGIPAKRRAATSTLTGLRRLYGFGKRSQVLCRGLLEKAPTFEKDSVSPLPNVCLLYTSRCV